MGPIQHLSDLCQQENNIDSILNVLRQRVRGPSNLHDADATGASPDKGNEEEASGNRDGESEGNKYSDLMRYQDSDGRTALHWAIAMRNFSLAETLLDSPYRSVALTWDKGRCTPFLSACMVGAEEALLQKLLDRCVEEYPEVCRWLAAELDDGNTVEPAGTQPSPSPSSAAASESAARQKLRHEEEEDEDGRRLAELCPLQRLPPSAWDPSLQVNSPAGSGKPEEENAAAIAAQRKEVVALLESVVVNAGDSLGNTPLLTAVSRGHMQMIAFLLDHGADIGAQNKQGQTVLHRAASKSNYNLVELLIQKSAVINGGEKTKGHRQFVNKPDRRGDTALFYASMENDEEIGSYLLQHGADRDLKNKEGKYFYEV